MVLQPALGITRQDGFLVGLTAVDDDPLGPAMPLERLAQEPSGSREVAPLAEPELDRIAIAVDGSIEIFPLASDIDVSFVNVLLGSDGSLACIEALQKFRRVAHNPSVMVA
jgi:hypothetical protein